MPESQGYLPCVYILLLTDGGDGKCYKDKTDVIHHRSYFVYIRLFTLEALSDIT